MATVTGNLKDIGGSDMADRNAAVYFTLNAGNITASGGGIRPDIQKKVTPGSDGTFSANLEPTVSMLAEAWYEVRVEWLDHVGNLISYLQFQIKVPSGGGTLSELADLASTGGGSGANPLIWWVGLAAPQSRRYLWLHTNPNNPEDPANTGDVRQWR